MASAVSAFETANSLLSRSLPPFSTSYLSSWSPVPQRVSAQLVILITLENLDPEQ